MTGIALLIHGLSSSPAGWWRVRGWFEEAGWTTETVSLLGHDQRGPAPSYALDAYVDDVARAAPGPYDLVIGHSLGGSNATVLASRDANWARRLVLLDPVWYVPADQLSAVAADQLSELEWTPESLHAAKPHWHDHDLAAKLFAVSAVDPGAVGRTFAEADRWDLRDVARRILTPTLVLGGDPAVYTMLEPADAEEISESASEMTYRVVPGAGHSPHRDAPEATRELLLEWLD
jgi:pimeloyl-ACP methyl ester carboxylesterase